MDKEVGTAKENLSRFLRGFHTKFFRLSFRKQLDLSVFPTLADAVSLQPTTSRRLAQRNIRLRDG